ncbi:NAD(P)H-dependent oxidoreductase [Cellulophaga sp. HaHaR_3_176]|uniref:FMN-dependent NADH-azoreductase n=1 Tax=Cellulophaga sp. HaHaR_3_176 TaxID=1942464 RepID=UPI001C1F8FD8|nr:NAD(P)H-dependent oxidoreductase [Cellulophaga sp. HaHaR_3_176]QWX85592.1 NAD(P)H-dependent oxidoreductase [Cellulophaga sp. HaHaR_3_176]
MTKTLIVSYTPRVGSNTKQLVDYFIDTTKDKTEITVLDLTKNAPDLLLEEKLNLYVKRNFGGVVLTEEEQQVMFKNDKMVNQVLEADFIVLASPIFNMSVPATVKAWVDVVIQAGITFTQTEMGPKGLCENKQALVLMTSGSDFNIEPLKSVNFATPLVNACFGLMGIPATNITAFGLQQYPDKIEEMLASSKKEIDFLSKKWF